MSPGARCWLMVALWPGPCEGEDLSTASESVFPNQRVEGRSQTAGDGSFWACPPRTIERHPPAPAVLAPIDRGGCCAFTSTVWAIQDDIGERRQNDDDNMLPSSSVEEGMLWPQAMAGVVRPARVSNHPALARATATPPYPRRAVSSQTYVMVYRRVMKRSVETVLLFIFLCGRLAAETNENLVVEGIPAISESFKQDVSSYLEFRSALFNDWHPLKRQLLISTRFADTMQLHQVAMPLGFRRQLTFFPDRVSGGLYSPAQGDFLIFSKDTGGGEFFQLYRFDLAEGGATLLTDGKSRNTGPRWSNKGKWLAYTSTRRNGKDNDIYLIDPSDPKSDHLLVEVQGGGWAIEDWSPDDARMLLLEYISANESYLYLVDVKSGTKRPLTPKAGGNVSYAQAQFAHDGQSIFTATDKDSEFKRLVRLDLSKGTFVAFPLSIPWDIEEFELSSNGKTLAFVSNENGSGILHLFDTTAGREVPAPKLPLGVLLNLNWHHNSQELAFNLTSARSPSDVYSLNVDTGQVERWTESETGGLNTTSFAEPELVSLKGFDGLSISAFVYRPDRSKFPGKRPVMIDIHGGPESQSRPAFLGRYNYLINELGITMVFPNVRGSSGYGKTFLTLDNGLKREEQLRVSLNPSND
jgi:dipeptidyl aminopeptidase/acylaminoacyl peptidase